MEQLDSLFHVTEYHKGGGGAMNSVRKKELFVKATKWYTNYLTT
jgi:hypothetical protein